MSRLPNRLAAHSLARPRAGPQARARRGKRRCGGAQRSRLDLDNRTVRVVETVYELDRLVKGKPKSEASIRKVVLPELIIPDLVRHMDAFAGQGPDGFVFVGVKGGQLRRSTTWARALAKAGLPAETHVHDLRHSGNTLSAEAARRSPS